MVIFILSIFCIEQMHDAAHQADDDEQQHDDDG